MPMPRATHRRLVRGFSLHPMIIECINREARARNMSRSRVVEDVVAQFFGVRAEIGGQE